MIIQNSLKLLHELSHLEKQIGEIEQIILNNDINIDLDQLLSVIISNQKQNEK